MKKLLSMTTVLAGVAFAAPAFAGTVTDCPNRDAPFSAASPLIDVLLSPAAKAVIDKHAPGRLDKMPPNFAGTRPPTFAAILTAETATRFTGMTADKVAEIDRELRAIPVTDADKAARCARYDNDVPSFNLPKGKVRLLVMEKINGFKDEPSVNAAHAALVAMAERRGWAIAFTEKAGAINPKTLAQFDAVVWNNVSGDILTLSQRKAFKDYMARGGAFAAMHGSAGDPAYFWDWYPDTLIGARFAGHPMAPQFQEARVVVSTDHPVAKAAKLPREWRMTDEWYSFKTSPRAVGAQVIASLDETTYSRKGMMGASLDMGADHPIAWTNCIGRGRMFYTAIGHMPQTYSQPQALALLEAGIDWAATSKKACPARR
ncbi:ThuA domain-containing protein [Novosphingobium sp. TH158]|uniref:ThuA domain-containing protein n=1 Tax=Novosphingobium sp. TH158 TaxID=2067455 RepID=UPI000C7A53E6|nr:ThuA domain-containing protein [Novosphingobium sp. TH158]PLK26449.1 ThuA domain-containing protein [Novosphingobium sp. TH158]